MQSYHPQTFWKRCSGVYRAARPSLRGPMQHGRALSLDEQKLVVGFAHKFSLDYLRDPENFMVVRDAAQAFTGRSFHIVLEPSDTGAQTSMHTRDRGHRRPTGRCSGRGTAPEERIKTGPDQSFWVLAHRIARINGAN